MAADATSKPPEQLRNYQAELFDIVKRQNSILFLPTGSGKTCIAIWLIKHLAEDLKKSYSEGGKRTIFIVNTTELAYQQAKYVEDSGNFKVKVVCAKENVDNWGSERWDALEMFEVIVLTAQCYLDALTHGYMLLKRANLLIFDECHHATKAHPMREIMLKFKILPVGNEGPRVLGLSATILNRNKKSHEIGEELAELENTFRASIVTSTFTQDIKKFATKPDEVIKDFEKLVLPPALAEFLRVTYEESEHFAKCFKLESDDNVEYLMMSKPGSDAILLNVPGINRTKLLTSAVKDINVHCHEFGIYIGYMACQVYIIQMYRFMFELGRSEYRDLVLYFINVVQVIRKTLYNEIMENYGKFNLETMMQSSTKKLKYLFDVLREMEPKDKCIIFVERKITAKVMCFIIKLFSQMAKASHIRVDFITGSECHPFKNTRELSHEKKVKDKVLKSFRGDVLNVLVATNIVEEGIDIPDCGLVIMFDEIKTYRSYVQSKGRARQQTSKYIVLNDVPRQTFLARLKGYRDVELYLNSYIRDKDISKWEEDDSPDGSESGRFYTTPKGANIKEENCVSLIYYYCSSLPSDIYTQLIPYWWLIDAGEEKICKLQLPVNSPIREILQGPPRPNMKKAKQAVAFMAVDMLHKLGGLNDQLEPVRGSAALEDTKEWVPNWDYSETKDSAKPAVGQARFTSRLKLSTFLQDSRPVANEESYIHFIAIEPEYEVPDVDRKKFCHNLMASNYNFGILTRKPLPNICRFPVYSDLGRCQVSIDTNCNVVSLDEKQISFVVRFHKFLFLNVIRKVKKFFLFDVDSTSGYFIVPLTKKDTRDIDIAWKVVRQKIETVIRQPSELDRETEELSEVNFLGKVVAPWYRQVEDPTFYIVTNFLTGVHLHTQLENKKITYAEHFEKTYDLRAKQLGQPLMEVRTVTKNFDCVKPRAISSSTKQKNKNKEDHQTYLPPEFVTKQTLNSVYWYKSILLPSILHRFQQLLLAEDLRQSLVEKTGVGRFDVTIDRCKEHEYFLRTVEVPVTVQNISQNVRKLRLKERKAENDQVQPDLIRDINHCDDYFSLTLDDVEKFVNYIGQPIHPRSGARAVSFDSEVYCDGNSRENGEYVIRHMPAPELHTLKNFVDSPGPNQYDILQAVTLRGANDTIDLERFETLGDSLLKYLVSFAIFIREGRMNEGHLTSLKGRIIGNKYLFDCAKKHQIHDYIQSSTFCVDRTWIPPSFTVPPYLSDIVPELGKFSSLLKVEIPHHEQFSGNLSPDSVERIGNKLRDFFQSVEDIDKNEESIALGLLNLRKLAHKSIADVMEALIGVYLQNCGIEGAFNVMKYFGLLQKEDYASLMSYKITSSVKPERGRVLAMIPDYKKLESLLNYEFRDKALLLQALTHPSCLTNQLTDCYQKLEFIGDAVLDFLITSYIYEYCGQLSPGQITDLRASLVNNTTFGAMSVRLGLQKYLLEHNSNLEEAIRSFVSYQKSRNFEIHGNDMMTLVNEGDTCIAEEVDVPKALGDVFESLAGAIFLDSEYNLSIVWNIYFNIMAEEITKFCSKIPLNPIKVLHERFVNKTTFNADELKNQEASKAGDKLVVRLCVHVKKETHTFIGRGVNTGSAKRAAAKLALKKLGYSDFVI